MLGCDFLTPGDCTDDYGMSTTPFENTGMHGHVGNYYNWSAAALSNDSSSISNAYQEHTATPQNSVCPKGWRLPKGFNSDEFKDMFNSNNLGSRENEAPVYLVRSGSIRNSSLYGGDNGNWWTQDKPWDFNINENRSGYYAGTGQGYSKYGYTVRCIAR